MRPIITAYGEALWDLLPDGEVLGGALLNFTYRVKNLGADAELISRLGSDERGDKGLEQMEDLGFDVSYIQRDSDHPTGTVPVTFDENKNPSYVITPNAAYDFIEATDNYIDRVKGSDCLCFGSLIQRSRKSRETLRKLIEVFTGRYLLFDINLRKDCYTAAAVKESLLLCGIVKVNEEEIYELQSLLGLKGKTIRELARECLEQFDTEICLVTLGHQGLFAMDREGVEVYVPGYPVNLVDPIGAGDACTAGFVYTLLQGEGLEKAAKFANAIGAAVAETSGASAAVSEKEIRQKMDTSGKKTVHPEFE